MSSVLRQGYQRVSSVDADDNGSPQSVEQLVQQTENPSENTNEQSGVELIQPAPVVMEASPPPYIANDTQATSAEDLDPSPPKYGDIIKLPTYDEVELNHPVDICDDINEFLNDTTEENNNENRLGDVNIGTDFHFALTFLLSFFLNWIGFIMGYCLSTTLSAQYGAASGFGLSLMKWAFIMKHTGYGAHYLSSDPWVIWLFAISGWLIFIQGIFSYIKVKRAASQMRAIPSLIFWHQS